MNGRQAQREQRRPNTFDFLGFTHYCDRSRWGRFMVGRKTSGKKFRKKCRELNEWLKAVRNRCPVKEWWPVLQSQTSGPLPVLRDKWEHANVAQVLPTRTSEWRGSGSTAGANDDSFTWEQFWAYLKRYPLPEPRIVHNLYTLKPVT